MIEVQIIEVRLYRYIFIVLNQPFVQFLTLVLCLTTLPMKSNVDLDVDRYVFEHGEGGWRRGGVGQIPKEILHR